MRGSAVGIIALLVVIPWCAPARGQQSTPPASRPAASRPAGSGPAGFAGDAVGGFFPSRAHAATTRPAMLSAPPPPPLSAADENVSKAYADAEVAWYQYQTDGYHFRMHAFERQMLLSAWIFVVVLILVLSGVVFAGSQLYA